MGKKQTGQNWDMEEILGLKVNRFLYEVEDKLDIYRISVEIDESQMEELFLNTLEPEEEEVEAPETTRGFALIRKDSIGKYYALKNINFHLIDFLDAVLALIQTELRYKLIFGGIFLFRVMQYLGADMSEEQTAVLVALYQMTKLGEATDENVIEGIAQGLKESDYCELSQKRIEKKLLELMDMGLVSIEDSRYEVTETLVF